MRFWDGTDESLQILTSLGSSQTSLLIKMVSLSVSSRGSPLLFFTELGYWVGSWWMMGDERVKHKSLLAQQNVSLRKKKGYY